MEDRQTKAEAKKLRKELAIRIKNLKRIFWGIGFLIIAVFIIFIVVFWGGSKSINFPGEFYADAGQEHIGLSDNPPRPYTSNPPSSGGHFARPAKPGLYDYEINDKILIHNLEHGQIWIAYRPQISRGALNDLRSVVDEFSKSKIVMAPRSANDYDIAIAAWQYVYKFNVSGDRLTDEEKNNIRAFYKARLNRGPEFVPGNMGDIDPSSVPGGALTQGGSGK